MLYLNQLIKVIEIYKKTTIVKELKIQENDILKIILECTNTTGSSNGLYARYVTVYNTRNMLSKIISLNTLVNTLEISFKYDQLNK